MTGKCEEIQMPNEFLRWRFVDPHDPTTGATYVFPRNPNTMTSPFPRRAVTASGTTAINGRKIFTEAQVPVQEWTFGGNIHDSVHYEALRSWVYERTGRRIYLFDHFGRRFTVVPLQFNPTPKRTVGQYWRHTYEITCYVSEDTGPTFLTAPPTSPRNVVAVGGHLRVDVTFDPPESVGGSKLLKYEVANVTNNDVRDVISGAPLALTFRPITAGPKQISVTTVTAGGRSAPVTVPVTVQAKGAPSGFRILSLTVVRDYLTMKWSDPTDDGGEALRGWIVTLESTTGRQIGGLGPHEFPAATRKAVIKDLTPNSEYTLYLYGQNGIGSSPVPGETKRYITTLK